MRFQKYEDKDLKKNWDINFLLNIEIGISIKSCNIKIWPRKKIPNMKLGFKKINS